MKRKDSALQPASRPALKAPAHVCGAPTDAGSPCQRTTAAGVRCADHGGPGAPEAPVMRDGLRLPKVFADETRQRELERYVADCLQVYLLNDAADLRQIVLSGIAYVRLQFDGANMDPRMMDMLSRVVDRHLRSLRATPKEQAAGKTGGGGEGPQLPPGMMPAAILERVRLALTPGQVAQLVQGHQPTVGPGRLSDAGRTTESGELEILPSEPELFAAPRRAAVDPFGALDGDDVDGAVAPLAEEIDPFGD